MEAFGPAIPILREKSTAQLGKIVVCTDRGCFSVRVRPRKENSCVEHISSWLNGANASLFDTFSSCHELAQQRFTCWMQLANLRYCNKGARLDYILCDKRLFGTQLEKCEIFDEVEVEIWKCLKMSLRSRQPFLVAGALAGATSVSSPDSSEARRSTSTGKSPVFLCLSLLFRFFFAFKSKDSLFPAKVRS